MKHSFFFLTIICFSFSCENNPERVSLSPEQLLLDLNSSERIVSPEQVADWIVNDDPSLRLIDVRSHEEFDAFTLPEALNIPLENLLEEENQQLMDCSRYKIVFFSNDDLLATQAWTLRRICGCKDIYIMKGGLNLWTSTLISPPMPDATASETEWELYQFRKAISQYLIGGSEEMEPEEYVQTRKQAVAPKKAIEVKPKEIPNKKVVEEEEGC